MSSKTARISSEAPGNRDPGSTSSEPGRAQIAVGLLAAPGLPAEVAESLAPELSTRLNELYPEVKWAVPLEIDGLVVPPASTTELIDAAHERLLGQDWELALSLTDLPLQGRSPHGRGTREPNPPGGGDLTAGPRPREASPEGPRDGHWHDQGADGRSGGC